MGLFEWCKDCKYEIKSGCVNTLHCVEGNKYLKDLSKSKCEDCANLKTVAIDGLRDVKICDFGKECIDRNLFRPKEIKADKIQPGYYHKGKVDTIKFCLENDLDFLQGNIVKYVVRYKEKNGLEDLNKAMEYLKRLIESEMNK